MIYPTSVEDVNNALSSAELCNGVFVINENKTCREILNRKALSMEPSGAPDNNSRKLL